MAILNFEFKARTTELDILEKKFLQFHPKFIGKDNQNRESFST